MAPQRKKKNKTPKKPYDRKEANRKNMRKKRAAETVEQRQKKNKNRRDKAKTTKKAIWADLKLAAFNYKCNIDYRYTNNLKCLY